MDVLIRIIAACLVIAVLSLLWWFSRNRGILNIGPLRLSTSRLAPEAIHSPLQILARTRLTATHQLHLVQAMDQTILLCTFPNGACVVTNNSSGKTEG